MGHARFQGVMQYKKRDEHAERIQKVSGERKHKSYVLYKERLTFGPPTMLSIMALEFQRWKKKEREREKT